jgi:dipeptidyl aminopeptidase/acylaminoacyl peptidase
MKKKSVLSAPSVATLIAAMNNSGYLSKRFSRNKYTSMKRLLIAIACSALMIPCSSQGKKTISHETMWLMKRVGAPQVSPNGKWVVFSVTEPSYDEKEVVNDLWLVPADGSIAPRKITANKGGEGGYKWSPDSKFIAFTSKRDADEVGQIYILNIAEGGEAQRFTELSTGASAPLWSPDGKSIAFTTKAYPGAYTDSANKKIAEERKKQKYKARVYTSYPVRNWDQWVDEKQTHIYVQSLTPGAKPRNLFSEVAMLNDEGFNATGEMCWSADGSKIVFVATNEMNKSIYQDVVNNLYSVSLAGGNAVQLTNDGADYGSPALTADGKYLLCSATEANKYKVYYQNKLTRFDWPSIQNKTVVASNFDKPVNSFQVASNGTIYMSVEDQSQDKIFSVNVNGGTPRQIINNPHGCLTGLSIAGDGSVLVSNYDDATMPAEVVKLQPANSSYSFITSFNNEKLAALDLTPVEWFWTKSSRGKQIHSMLVKPAGFDAAKKYPLYVVMHGGPASSWKDNWGYRWNYQMLASPGYAVVLTNYTGSPGYGEKFAQEIQYDPFKGPANEINEAAADAIKKYPFIDGNRQAAGGASYGGHLANWMEATTTHYKCLISHAGLVNSEAQWGTSDGNYGREVMAGGVPWLQAKTWKEQNPIRYAANFKTPMLVTVGEQDYRVPLNNSLENWAALQRQKVPSKLIIFPEENHWILKPEDSRFFYQETQAWLKKYL